MNHDPQAPSETAAEPSVAAAMTSHDGVISLLGVEYLRRKTGEGGDLYLTTRFGVPFRELLDPENWYAPGWFDTKRTRLEGTSAIYKVPTRMVRGVSLDLVARFSRVGEEVPVDMLTRCKSMNTEFNSPFEEFARVMELRSTRVGPSRPCILTKRPLAIYAPPGRVELWQTGRHQDKIGAKLAQHPEVELDIFRHYILLYGWIEGLNAAQTAAAFGVPVGRRDKFLAEATDRAILDLDRHGFRMLDIKPEHIVLRVRRDGSLLRRRNGEPAFALLDYELLERFRETN